MLIRRLIKMEEEIKRLQSDNVNRDVSGNNKTDTRSLFEQGVDIFKITSKYSC